MKTLIVDGEKALKRLCACKGKNKVCPICIGYRRILEKCTVDIQPPASAKLPADKRIEAAIRYFREQFAKREQAPYDEKYKITSAYGALVVADLCRYFLDQPQKTWTDADLEE